MLSELLAPEPGMLWLLCSQEGREGMQPQPGLTLGWWWRLEPRAAVGTPGGDTCPLIRATLGTLSSAMSSSPALGVFGVISGLVWYLVTSLSRGLYHTPGSPPQGSHPHRVPQLALNTQRSILIPA